MSVNGEATRVTGIQKFVVRNQVAVDNAIVALSSAAGRSKNAEYIFLLKHALKDLYGIEIDNNGHRVDSGPMVGVDAKTPITVPISIDGPAIMADGMGCTVVKIVPDENYDSGFHAVVSSWDNDDVRWRLSIVDLSTLTQVSYMPNRNWVKEKDKVGRVEAVPIPKELL